MLKKVFYIVLSLLVPGLALANGVAQPWQMDLQQAVSPVAHTISDFHNFLLIIITAITLFVLAVLIYVMIRFRAKRNPVPSKTTHNVKLEVIWTVIPILILVIIGVPSMKLLYFMDKTDNADLTLKITGHQWYWSYSYPDYGDFTFDSYMIPDKDIQPGQHRLLEVDNRVVLPVNKTVRLLFTADDVLHAWAVPALAVKKDTVPGKMNESWVRIEKEGVYYGQCSELCGVGHGFMPIAVEAVSEQEFEQWARGKQIELAPETINEKKKVIKDE